MQFQESHPRRHSILHTGENHILSFYNHIWYKTMPEYNLAELISLPLPLNDNTILRRRQFLRQELHHKVQQLRQIQNKRVFRIKCPCNFHICDHMDPHTANLMLNWCPLEVEFGFFFLQQPWTYLGIYIYPHCIECVESSVCVVVQFE